jgi:hypothetical protein
VTKRTIAASKIVYLSRIEKRDFETRNPGKSKTGARGGCSRRVRSEE